MKYELLAPVGDFRNLRAVVDAGADAVYFGIKGFNMRASAKNFGVRDLDRIRKICGKVKMYLTLNVVVYDEELKRIEDIVRKVKGKVDAVICWDLAVIDLCRKYKIPFHVSTQASVSNISAARFYKKLGAERIVLARELSLKQIAKIAKIVPVECFVHGAMCVAVSGRCFMSQDLTGCSANRGKCLQMCRRSWKISDERGNELRLENSRVMSAKDLCALPFVGKMKKAGVTSFKIEGRNRGPEYVGVVTREYRKALDGWPGVRKKEEGVRVGLENLRRVYHRGFSSGFYLGTPTADDFSFSEHGEQEEKKEFVGKVYKFWKKAGVASVLINTGRLKVGDEVYLISDAIGVKRVVVKSIELDGKSVSVAKKGDDIGVDFGESVGICEVYVIRKKD
ncbi:MAG: U32 family peptidase [archaeon]